MPSHFELANASKAVVGYEPSGDVQKPPLSGQDSTFSAYDTEKAASIITQTELVSDEGRVFGGVATVEAMKHVWSPLIKHLIWIGLGLMYTVYELDDATFSLYIPFATSSFSEHSLLAAITVIWSIVFAVGKPPIAKLSDVIGRAETYCICVASYCLAYIIIATSKNIQAYAAGFIFYAIGQSGIQILNVIIISDITTERWRAFWLAVAYFPDLITSFVAANIAGAVINVSTWRWGVGMFGFIMPGCAFVLIVGLFLAQRRARKGIPTKKRVLNINTIPKKVYDFFSAIDMGGILLLSGGAALVLVPCSLAGSTPSKWSNPRIDACLGVGAAFLVAFPVYERFVAAHPLIPFFFLKNRSIVVSCILSFLDSCSWALVSTYLYSWILVTQGWSTKNAGYYTYAHGLTWTVSAAIAGAIMLKTRRYKYILFSSVAFRMIGLGLMLRFRRAPESVALLVMTQVVSGFGSGVVVQVSQVASQIVVKHEHLASVTAFVLLCSFLGTATGESIAGGMWTSGLPGLLAKNLPNLSPQEVADIFGSITSLPALGTPTRAGISVAYVAMMRRLVICAMGVAAPSFIIMWFIPDLYLSDSHNQIDSQKAKTEETGPEK